MDHYSYFLFLRHDKILKSSFFHSIKHTLSSSLFFLIMLVVLQNDTNAKFHNNSLLRKSRRKSI